MPCGLRINKRSPLFYVRVSYPDLGWESRHQAHGIDCPPLSMVLKPEHLLLAWWLIESSWIMRLKALCVKMDWAETCVF